MKQTQLTPVILCGGSGSRLWPLSRQMFPKQFIRLPDGDTLLGKTLKRVKQLGADNVIIVGADTHRFFMREILTENGCEDWKTILEPSPQNTAAAIALAAKYAADRIGDVPLFVLPADHLIQDVESFVRQAETAAELSESGHFVTFGIRPTRAETGYGYIQAGDSCDGVADACRIKQFKEKPELNIAQQWINEGDRYWNSGMFVFKTRSYLEQLNRHQPQIHACISRAYGSDKATNKIRIDASEFARCPDVSVDHALMEKAVDVVMIKAKFDWNDVGSWKEFSSLIKPDGSGNRAIGPIEFKECKNTTVFSENKLVALIGVDNVVVVETPDALLITAGDKTQKVRDIVCDLKERGYEQTQIHRTVYRPWGAYTNVDADDGFQVKRIVVNPGQCLSLQRHRHRSEHWVVVDGTVIVTRGDEVLELNKNESTYIPIGVKHRLENKTDIPASLIEVQCGSYLGEDDIERFADRYGRDSDD